jgi:hypothetical protein
MRSTGFLNPVGMYYKDLKTVKPDMFFEERTKHRTVGWVL